MSKFGTFLGNASMATKDSRQGKDATHQQNMDDAPQGAISYMDGTRCMLYAHGGKFILSSLYRCAKSSTGGYYFGSIDQERYVCPFEVILVLKLCFL
jgi:hypothetical protein